MRRIRKPEAAEIARARRRAGLTQSEAAALIHAQLRSWQHYEGGERGMHPGLWELFLIKSGRTLKR